MPEPTLTPTQRKALAYIAAYAPQPRHVHTDYWGSSKGSEGIRHDTLFALERVGLIVTHRDRERYDVGRDGGRYWSANVSATVTPAGTAWLRAVGHQAKANGRESAPSVFVDMRPPPAQQLALARSGTVSPPDLHLTLAFLGRLDALPPDTGTRVRRAMDGVARRVAPIVAWTRGLRRFPGDAEDVVYVAVESQPLMLLRAALVERLRAEGVAVDATHAFVPHLRVGTARSGDVWGFPTPPAMALDFRAMTLWVGRVRVETVQLTGPVGNGGAPNSHVRVVR